MKVVGEDIAYPSSRRDDFGWIEVGKPNYFLNQLEPIDSMDFEVYLWPQEDFVVRVGTDYKLHIHKQPEFPLISLSQQAVELAPKWLKEDLIDNLRMMDSSFQQIYSQMIIDAPIEWKDEISFLVAHVSPEILMDSIFDPQLLLVDVELIYSHVDSFDYVEMVEEGGENYYTTLKYRIIQGGDTTYYTIPKEIYYYYVVHPQLSDECPRMDSYVYNKFWREFFFSQVDSGYPILSEKLRPTSVVWDGEMHVLPGGREFNDSDLALDVIGNWTTELVPDAAYGNRPIQPNVIVYEHNGNCGELQDALQAAARTALIPATGVFTLAEDHVWNEFYIDGWHEYQVDLGHGSTHIDDPSTGYDRDYGGSKDLSSVMEWRSDGLVRTVTSHYSKTCSLHVQVLDLDGRPIDGARILLYSDYIYGGYSISCWGFTDSHGICEFELGDLRDFYIHINTPMGDYPEGPNEIIKIISLSQSDAHYYKVFHLPYHIPSPPRIEISFDDTSRYWLFEVELELPFEIEHGYARARRNTGDSGFYHTYLEKKEGGEVDLFVTDSSNLKACEDSLPFYVVSLRKRVGTGSYQLFYPVSHEGLEWWPYLVLSNREFVTTTKVIRGKIRLYGKGVGIEEVVRRKRGSFSILLTEKGARIIYQPEVGGAYRALFYNEAGRLINMIRGEIQGNGKVELLLKRKEFPSGVYFIRFTTPQGEIRKKFVLF